MGTTVQYGDTVVFAGKEWRDTAVIFVQYLWLKPSSRPRFTFQFPSYTAHDVQYQQRTRGSLKY